MVFIALRVLAADNCPAHRTLWDFRALHLEELAALFVQVVRLARECGSVKLGTVAADGTKLKANASRHKAMSCDRRVKAEAELKAQIDGLLNLAKAVDDLKRSEPALDIPAEIRHREDWPVAVTAAKVRSGTSTFPTTVPRKVSLPRTAASFAGRQLARPVPTTPDAIASGCIPEAPRISAYVAC